VNPRLAALSDDDRQAVEARLVEFDQGWDERRLVRQAQEIPPDSSWRLPALAEMVKIDLERQWQRGRQVSLESYLQEFPELGSPGDVSADLIQAEFEVRRQFGVPAVLEDYLRRFPNQAAEIARRIAQGGSALSRRSAAGDRKPATAPLDLPEQFGRYRLIKRLGQGGMGSVYLAEDTQLQRRVALKVARDSAVEGSEMRRRLLAEARAAATLDHPYLCPVFDAGEVDGRLYLTMAYIEGQSLAEMAGGKSLPPRQVAALVGKLALALQEAHAKGVVHRDLKPSNVMIKATGARREPVIVDFGLAYRDNPNESRISTDGRIMGTLAWMAPEQIRGELKEIGPACDIYALGVILYELLTGRLPFSGLDLAVIAQILTQEPLPPSTFRPDLDPRLEAICLKAMAKTMTNRYASMADLAAVLTDFLRSPSATATAASSPSPSAAASSTPPAGTDTLVDRLLERVAEVPASVHPSDQTLRSYGLGKLDDRSAEAVNEHLMECSDCRKRVAEMSADSFLQRVRDAQKPSGKSTSGQSQAGGTRTDKSTGTWTSSSGDSLPPELAALPGYEIKRKLGQGGMGVVYLAHNRMMGRDEVLKVMGQHLMGYPGALERFMREIRSVARLHHSNIVTAYHATQIGQSLLFAMEYVDGHDLSELVKTKGRLPVAQACLFTYQAALGLQHAHEEGLIHRDLKPNNLILSRKGEKATVKILDFGLAKAAREGIEAELSSSGPSLTGPNAALGTPAYMAPEQITDAATVDIRADIYSLGGTLYFLLTGRPPFLAKTQYELFQAHISRIPDPLNLVRPDVPQQLAALVAKMLAKDPAERFQTPGEAAQALKPFCTKAYEPTEIETPPEGWPGPRPDDEPRVAPRPATPWLWPAVAVGVLMLGLLAALVFKVKTKDGTIVLENVPKDSEILVDGETITLSWPGVGKPFKIRKAPGEHRVEVKKDGFKTFGEVVTVKTDESEEVTIRLEPLVVNRPDLKRPEPTDLKRPEPTDLRVGSVDAKSAAVPKELTNSLGMRLVLIPAGEFLMGSPDSDEYAEADEKPEHRVRITQPFYLGVTEVTVGQFRRFVEKTGYRTEAERDGQGGGGWNEAHTRQFRDPRFSWRNLGFVQTDESPVANVTWNDAVAFCKKLSDLEGLNSRSPNGTETPTVATGYRLPTEAEWEYACRAGSTTYGSGVNVNGASLADHAWTVKNSHGVTHPVGQKCPNAFGLYDMLGNVWEWCWDAYQPRYYLRSPIDDPSGPSRAGDRLIRGSCWMDDPRIIRSRARNRTSPTFTNHNLGFRVVRVQPAP
jgi:serine/threonine protein kinase/formylglycine-generating enzyme required for sulfatase activity